MLKQPFRKSRRFVALIAGCAAFLLIAGCAAGAGQTAAREDAQDLVIALSELTEEPQFFPYSIDGKEMEIIALNASDGTVRTAFNTCQVCFSSGRGYYKVEGDKLVCQNCGNPFGFDEIALTRGGCNPVPITEEERSEKDGSLVLSAGFLKEASQLFENWK